MCVRERESVREREGITEVAEVLEDGEELASGVRITKFESRKQRCTDQTIIIHIKSKIYTHRRFFLEGMHT